MSKPNFTQSEIRIASAVWVIGIILTGFLLSVPPANVPVFIGLACLAIVPLFSAASSYRVFGVIAIVVSLLAVTLEIWAGIRLKEKRREHFISEIRQGTNAGTSSNRRLNDPHGKQK